MFLVSSIRTWEEHSLPISFSVTPIEHLVAGLSAMCQGVAITGAGTGHSDKDYFRVASNTNNIYVRWLVMGY